MEQTIVWYGIVLNKLRTNCVILRTKFA